MIKYALSVKQSLLFTELSLTGCSQEYFKRVLGIEYSLSECLIRGDDLFWNYDDDIGFNKAFLKNITLNQAVNNFNRSLTKKTNELEEITEKIIISSEWKKKDKKYIKSALDLYINSYLLNMPFLFQYWNVEHLLISQLKTDFSAIFGESDKEKKLQQVLIPSKATYFAKERRSLEEIALFVSRDKMLKTLFQKDTTSQIEKKLDNFPHLKSMLEKHVKEFGFTSFVLHLGSPMSINTLLERTIELIKEAFEEKIKTYQSQMKEEKEKTEQILKQLLPFKDIRERVLLAQDLMFWKNQRLDILFKSDLKIKPVYDAIAALMGISFDQFVYLRFDEIQAWFKTNHLPPLTEINQRVQGFALYLKNGKITLFIDESKYPKVEEKTIDDATKNNHDDTIIKGSTAYPGNVIGKVKLIFTIEDIKKVQKGDILVTRMTRPEMIIGLEKAAAFVTDQGGILSHAAIVSREMKKPCIIGTKIATRALQDGDLVEVDAEKGIVRILESRKIVGVN